VSAVISENYENGLENEDYKTELIERYPLVNINDITPNLDRKTIIRGLIKPETMVVTYGASNSGKTFHVLDRDICLSAGNMWYDRETEPGLVIYIAAEGSHSVFDRVSAYKTEYLNEKSEIPFYVLPKSINLLNPAADTNQITDFVKMKEDELGIGCIKITVDTLARAMAGGNENSPEDMGHLVANADRIRHDVNCCFEFVHHSGKDQAAGARGHSSLKAATDTEIEVIEKDKIHFATASKQRDLQIGDEFAYTLKVINLGNDRYGHPITTCVPVWNTYEKRTTSKQLTNNQKSFLGFMTEAFSSIATYPPRELIGIKNAPKTGKNAFPWANLQGFILERGGIGDGETIKNQKRTLTNVRNQLRDLGLIGVRGDFIWLTGKEGK
jgi:hypothetical protein